MGWCVLEGSLFLDIAQWMQLEWVSEVAIRHWRHDLWYVQAQAVWSCSEGVAGFFVSQPSEICQRRAPESSHLPLRMTQSPRGMRDAFSLPAMHATWP